MEKHLMAAVEFGLNMLKEMTVEVTATEGEVGIDVITEIEILVEDKFPMENSREPTIAWWLRTCPLGLLGRT